MTASTHLTTRGSSLRVMMAVAISMLAWETSAVQAAPVSMAIMGDSLSITAHTYNDSWVNQLSAAGAITPFDAAADGAESSNVVASQLPGIINDVHQGKITDSILMVGGNDLFFDYGGDILDGGDPTAFINQYVNNVEQVLTSIAAAGPVHQVLANIPNLIYTAAVIEGMQQEPDLAWGAAENAIITANSIADQFALSHGIPVLDLYTASASILALPYTLAGHTFTSNFTSNGIDTVTYVEGLLANGVAEAFNLGYGQTLPLLSDQQILINAGFTPNAGVTYTDMAPYVILPTPEPASFVPAAIGLAAFLAFRRRLKSATSRPKQ